jgi:hypothetical protein
MLRLCVYALPELLHVGILKQTVFVAAGNTNKALKFRQ